MGNDDGVTPIDLAARCGGSALLFRMIRESGALVVLASKMVRRAEVDSATTIQSE